MPAYYRAQVSLANDSGLSRDVSQNTFHFKVDTTEQNAVNDLLAIADTLDAFYQAIDEHLSENVAATGGRVKIYNLIDPPTRSPVADIPLTDLVTGGSGLPNEVALCLSYRGAITSGVNRRRNSGRIYTGPLSASFSLDSTGDMRPTTAARTLLITAATNFLHSIDDTSATGTVEWCVFSRSNALGLAVGEAGPDEEPTYDAAGLLVGFRPVTFSWVDDAFDTQRRRGLQPTTRTSFGI